VAMARSSGSVGCRTTKANRAEAMAIKLRLSRVPMDQWQRAQVIMDELVACTNAKGPTGQNMVPRACKYCGFYGHTRQFCDKKARDVERDMHLLELRCAAEYEEVLECHCTPERWAWILKFRAIEAKAFDLIGRGVACDNGVAVQGCRECAGCVVWDSEMAPFR
jgi:hypothetical protein